MTLFPRTSILLLFSSLLIFGCASKKESEDTAAADSVDTSAAVQTAEETGVTGDFDGDGQVEKVLVRVVNDANVNPDEPWQYLIEFSDSRFKSIDVSPMVADGYTVLNEGNIDDKPGDELSILTCDINKMGSLSLYRFDGKDWTRIAEPVNVACVADDMSVDDMLVKTDSGVYAVESETISYDSVVYKNREVILASTSGDFDGDGSQENVYIQTIHDAALDDSGYWEYSIFFSNTKIPALTIENHQAGGCDVSNEGNKDGKAGDELSVTTRGMMNRVTTEVYRFDGKKWLQFSTASTGGENAEP